MNKSIIPHITVISICIALSTVAICYTFLESNKPVSFEQALDDWKKDTNQPISKVTTTNSILWAKRTMTFLLENGKVEELQIGLAPDGGFVWRKIADYKY